MSTHRSWMGVLALLFTLTAQAETVHFQGGDRSLSAFIAEVSERLNLSIDASTVDADNHEQVNVPELGLLDPDRARELAITTLYLSGYTWIHDAPTDLYRIVRLRDARDLELRVFDGLKSLPDSDELVTVVIPVKEISPEQVARNLRSFMPAASRIIPISSSKQVFVTDSAHNIAKLGTLLERLDTPQSARALAEHPTIYTGGFPGKSAPCREGSATGRSPSLWLLTAMFSLIAAVIGFLARGYLIRRIEGGL